MAVSCILFEITRDIGRKTPIFHSSLPFNLHDHLYIETLRIISQNFNTNCPSSWVIKWCKDIAEKFNLMSRVQKRYRRHTDDRRIGDDISNVSLKRLFSLNSPGASTLRMGVKGNLELLTQFFSYFADILSIPKKTSGRDGDVSVSCHSDGRRGNNVCGAASAAGALQDRVPGSVERLVR